MLKLQWQVKWTNLGVGDENQSENWAIAIILERESHRAMNTTTPTTTTTSLIQVIKARCYYIKTMKRGELKYVDDPDVDKKMWWVGKEGYWEEEWDGIRTKKNRWKNNEEKIIRNFSNEILSKKVERKGRSNCRDTASYRQQHTETQCRCIKCRSERKKERQKKKTTWLLKLVSRMT